MLGFVRRVVGYIAWETGRVCGEPCSPVWNGTERRMVLCDRPPHHRGRHSGNIRHSVPADTIATEGET